MGSASEEPLQDPGMTAKLHSSFETTGFPAPAKTPVSRTAETAAGRLPTSSANPSSSEDPFSSALPSAVPAPSSASPAPGGDSRPRIPDVQLEQLLGQGGMGAVFRGRQITLDRAVAVKVIHPGLAKDDSFVKRFEREAKVLAKLSHPNIVACYQAGRATSGEHYLLMEFIEGHDLRHRVEKGGALGELEALVLTRQVVDALAHALEAGVIHRDVKPENILLKVVAGKGSSAASAQAKLVDLGLASLARNTTNEAARITEVGTAVGTPVTMAPEQAEEPDSIDHRADIYALGCTLYYALTKHFPHEGTVAQVIAKKLRGDTASPKTLRANLSDPVVQLILRMVALLPGDRPANYDELLERIDAVIATLPAAGPITARLKAQNILAIAETSPEPAGKPTSGGSRAGLALATLAVVGLGGFGAYRWSKGQQPAPPVATPSPSLAPTSAPVATPPAPPSPPAPTGSPALMTSLPPLVRWVTMKHLFDGDEGPLSRWEREPKVNSWQEAADTGTIDAVLVKHERVALFLKPEDVPHRDWKLTGTAFPKGAPYVGVRVILADRQVDFTILPVNPLVKDGAPTTVRFQLVRRDAGHERDLPYSSSQLADCAHTSLEFTIQRIADRLWAQIGDGAREGAWLSCDAPGELQRLGLFARKLDGDERPASASFGSAELGLGP